MVPFYILSLGQVIAIANKNTTFERTDIRDSILECSPGQGDNGVQGDAEAEDEVSSEGHFGFLSEK